MIVFVVEDDGELRSFLELLLAEHSVRAFASGGCALQAMRDTVPDVLLCDLGLPDISGEDVAAEVACMKPPPRIVLMSGQPDRLHRARALAQRVIRKPFSLQELSNALRESGEA
jgi:DNA-binding response OmpR family regulator